jgi:hypothetical protein
METGVFTVGLGTSLAVGAAGGPVGIAAAAVVYTVVFFATKKLVD